jgi:Pao retrotransposon peptidase
MQSSTSTLRISWHPADGTLLVSASVYDPLGLLTPVTLKGKALFISFWICLPANE